jgi:hypothetical protein
MENKLAPDMAHFKKEREVIVETDAPVWPTRAVFHNGRRIEGSFHERKYYKSSRRLKGIMRYTTKNYLQSSMRYGSGIQS